MMVRRVLLFARWVLPCAVLILKTPVATAQVRPASPPAAYAPAALRAALAFGPVSGPMYKGQAARSVPLAFGLSALVPGAGQVYNREWVKAAAAVAIELGVLWGWSSWREKGAEGRDAYQAMAHMHWSPVRYSLWLNDYTVYLNTLPGGPPVDAEPIAIDPALFSLDFSQPGGWSTVQQLAVRRLILDIRALETRVYHPQTGARFSHQLPFFAEQQYYELIGKYFQFAPGWDDYYALTRDGRATWIDADGNFIDSIDPEATAADGTKAFASDRFFHYAARHGEANDYFRRASRVTILLFANHLLTAVEAAISAKLQNDRLRVRVGQHQAEPALVLQLSF